MSRPFQIDDEIWVIEQEYKHMELRHKYIWSKSKKWRGVQSMRLISNETIYPIQVIRSKL